jgi:hypothetical protein
MKKPGVRSCLTRLKRLHCNCVRRVRELASSLTRNQVPGNRLRVRLPCPPLTYAGHDSAWPDDIGLATSTDGVNFSKQGRISDPFTGHLRGRQHWHTFVAQRGRHLAHVLPCRNQLLGYSHFLVFRSPAAVGNNGHKLFICRQKNPLPQGRNTMKAIGGCTTKAKNYYRQSGHGRGITQ